jgi:transposase-like protein
MERRRFSREFKLEAVKLIKERGVRPGCARSGAPCAIYIAFSEAAEEAGHDMG